ncbi:MAG TPA: Smr/MutS family protein [Deltaproteobacteria bacterium]|nr:Smr/MutS family protein [Deltaproteobacteria bacterium]HQB39042.1 Smr/MutS family protein [Deltaproteobacteria bacterium]
MAKKKTEAGKTPEKAFRTAPFSDLKGLALPPIKSAEPVKPQQSPIPARQPQDEELFLQAMQGVNRLGARTEKPAHSQLPATERKPPRAESTGSSSAAIPEIERNTFANAIKAMKLDVKFDDNLPEEEEFKPIGNNRLRQLKRGVITVDRQLDLHGLTRIEAVEALPGFFESAIRHGEKAVLIITGKGLNSTAEPVIQQAVAAWLKDSGSQYAIEFAPAPREMGGSGAFVVFLRNQAR